MWRIRENVKEEEDRVKERRDLDTSHITGESFIPKPLSVFPGTIRHDGYIRTLA